MAAIIRDVMLSGRSERELDGTPEAIGIAGYTSGTAPLLGFWLERDRFACQPAVAALLGLHLKHNRLRMERMAERARTLGRVLSERRVPAILLKGMHTAYDYFPEPGTRPLSDIDLLIAPDDKERAREALLDCNLQPGLERTWPFEQIWRSADTPAEPRTLCLVHADDPWTLDLHTSLDRRYAAGSPIIRSDDARGNCVPGLSGLTPELHVLPQPTLVLQLAVHAGCGLANLSLVRLVELAFVIRRDVPDGSLSWESFRRAAERAKAVGSVYPALKACEDLVPGTVPSDVLTWSRRDVPLAVRSVVDIHTPATAHQVARCSMAERFMWAPSRWAMFRQVLDEALPAGSASLPALAAIYRTRIMRMARRTATR